MDNDLLLSKKLGKIDLNRDVETLSLYTYWCRVALRKFETPNLKEHCHSFWEFHACLCGESVLEVDGVEHTLTVGNFLFIPPQKKHTIKYESDDFSKFIWGFSVGDQAVSDKLAVHYDKVSPVETDSEITNSISSILRFADSGGFGFYSMIKNNLYGIFVQLSRNILTDENTENYDKTYHAEMEAIAQYISNNIASNVGIEDVSAQFLLSKKKIEQMCSKEYGMTFSALKRSLQTERIRELLANTECSLDKIAELTGFSDRYSLGKFFKKHEGVPPAQFRTSLKK